MDIGRESGREGRKGGGLPAGGAQCQSCPPCLRRESCLALLKRLFLVVYLPDQKEESRRRVVEEAECGADETWSEGRPCF